MGAFSIFVLLSFNFLLLSCLSPVDGRHGGDGPENTREALEIIIGGGGVAPSPDNPDCPPPPPPPPCPPPPPAFENSRLKKSYFVIQRFRKRVSCSKIDVHKEWVGTNVCDYKGFRCDPLPGTKERAISGASFNGFKCRGSNLILEGFLEELDDIAFFHANSNFFVGGIPKKISQQPFFYELDLSNNRLSGQFPAEVLGARLLTFLDLRFNDFCGPIPEQLFNQDIISAIFINNNRFNSHIPYNLGKTPARYLTFASNQFTGPIPRSIGEAKNTMEEIVFFNNTLEGCLPYEIGFLEKATLFDASKNQLTGPIPLSFGCLAKMELLNLADNQFYGPVPEVVCKLPKLGNFTLRNNFFTQVGPECMKLIKKKILDVSNNCIVGLPNQRPKCDCVKFSSRPKYYGNDKSLKFVPCKSNWYLHPYVSEPSGENVNYVSPKKTYAALSPEANGP